MSHTDEQTVKLDVLEPVVGIVTAYLSNNQVDAKDIPDLISTIHASLLATAGAGEPEKPEEVVPAVPVRKSITPDYLICLLDGKKFKSLKRHLRTAYDMTPDQYRAKFNLPSDYPMVAPNYAEQRSALAREMGLGLQRRNYDQNAAKTTAGAGSVNKASPAVNASEAAEEVAEIEIPDTVSSTPEKRPDMKVSVEPVEVKGSSRSTSKASSKTGKGARAGAQVDPDRPDIVPIDEIEGSPLEGDFDPDIN